MCYNPCDPNATHGEDAMTTEPESLDTQRENIVNEVIDATEHWPEGAKAIVNEAMRRSDEANGDPHPSGKSQYLKDRLGMPLPAWADQAHEWAMNDSGEWTEGDYCLIAVDDDEVERLKLDRDTVAVWIIGNAVDGLNVGQLTADEYTAARDAMLKLEQVPDALTVGDRDAIAAKVYGLRNRIIAAHKLNLADRLNDQRLADWINELDAIAHAVAPWHSEA